MFNYIDIFSGAGGMSEGFRSNGFKPIAYVEMDSDAYKTLETRNAYYWLKNNSQAQTYFSYLKGEITREKLMDSIPEEVKSRVINLEMNESSMEKLFNNIDALMKLQNKNSVDLVIGGPPCQPFSIASKNRRTGKKDDDPRNSLYKHYVKVLHRYNPEIFVFENVPGLKSASNGEYLKTIGNEFENLGYHVKLEILNSYDYGVMQNRKRIIVIGSKAQNDFFDRIKEGTKQGKIEELFEDLPFLNPGEKGDSYSRVKHDPPLSINNELRKPDDVLTWHRSRPVNERDREIYRKAIEKWDSERLRLKYDELPSHLQTHKNTTTFLDRFKVVAGDLPYSHTLTAHIAKDGHYYIHPDKRQARSISVREAARLQSFPDDYYFEGSRTSVFRQIGNAVPPEMSSSIADAIEEMLTKS